MLNHVPNAILILDASAMLLTFPFHNLKQLVQLSIGYSNHVKSKSARFV